MVSESHCDKEERESDEGGGDGELRVYEEQVGML
jgi:hypothetical protein